MRQLTITCFWLETDSVIKLGCEEHNAIPKCLKDIYSTYTSHLPFQQSNRSRSVTLSETSCKSCAIRLPNHIHEKSKSSTRVQRNRGYRPLLCLLYWKSSGAAERPLNIHSSSRPFTCVSWFLEGNLQTVCCLTRRWQCWRQKITKGSSMVILVWCVGRLLWRLCRLWSSLCSGGQW